MQDERQPRYAAPIEWEDMTHQQRLRSRAAGLRFVAQQSGHVSRAQERGIETFEAAADYIDLLESTLLVRHGWNPNEASLVGAIEASRQVGCSGVSTAEGEE